MACADVLKIPQSYAERNAVRLVMQTAMAVAKICAVLMPIVRRGGHVVLIVMAVQMTVALNVVSMDVQMTVMDIWFVHARLKRRSYVEMVRAVNYVMQKAMVVVKMFVGRGITHNAVRMVAVKIIRMSVPIALNVLSAKRMRKNVEMNVVGKGKNAVVREHWLFAVMKKTLLVRGGVMENIFV